jgi:dipeptidase E
MKLYLSSYRVPVPEALFELVGKNPAEIKMALIPNAKDYYAERAWNFKTNQAIEYMKHLGFIVEVVDLRKFDNAQEVKSALQDFDIVWANGGNTFNLLYEMKRSGFDKAIKELLAEGKVYGGESAGALVAGNTVKGSEYADEPEFAEKVTWDGLKLTDHFVLPHVDNTDFGDAIQKAKDEHANDPTMILLNDNQAMIVDDTGVRTLSSD